MIAFVRCLLNLLCMSCGDSVDGASLAATSAASRPSCGLRTNTPSSCSGKAGTITRGCENSQSDELLQYDSEQKNEQDVYRSNCSQSSSGLVPTATVDDDSQGTDEMEECLVCKRAVDLHVTLQVLYLTFVL
jgi:hypothetical protein